MIQTAISYLLVAIMRGLNEPLGVGNRMADRVGIPKPVVAALGGAPFFSLKLRPLRQASSRSFL